MRCDVIMQMGTAKYGVRDAAGNLSEDRLRAIAAHPQVRMFEVKLAQGAKPGKGASCPRQKSQRRSPPSAASGRRASISPNRHKDIGNITELGQFINRVREVTGRPVG